MNFDPEPYAEEQVYTPSRPSTEQSALDQAHVACDGATQALYETVHMLKERLAPVLRSEHEDRMTVLMDGIPRSSDESSAVAFVHDQQQRAISMRATLDDVLGRLDV